MIARAINDLIIYRFRFAYWSWKVESSKSDAFCRERLFATPPSQVLIQYNFTLFKWFISGFRYYKCSLTQRQSVYFREIQFIILLSIFYQLKYKIIQFKFSPWFKALLYRNHFPIVQWDRGLPSLKVKRFFHVDDNGVVEFIVIFTTWRLNFLLRIITLPSLKIMTFTKTEWKRDVLCPLEICWTYKPSQVSYLTQRFCIWSACLFVMKAQSNADQSLSV